MAELDWKDDAETATNVAMDNGRAITIDDLLRDANYAQLPTPISGDVLAVRSRA